MQDHSLFKIAAIAFTLVAGWLLFLTLYSRRSDTARKRGLMLLGTSLIVLGGSYLVFAILLYLDSGYLYHSNRGSVVATAPGNSVLSLAVTAFVAGVPPLLLAGFGCLILKASRAGAKNSLKPNPLRGSA